MATVSQIQALFTNDYFESKEEIQEKINLVKGFEVKIEGIKTYVNGQLLPNTFPTLYFLNFVRPTNRTDCIVDGTYIINENGFLPNSACPTETNVLTNNDGDVVGSQQVKIENYKIFHSFIHGI